MKFITSSVKLLVSIGNAFIVMSDSVYSQTADNFTVHSEALCDDLETIFEFAEKEAFQEGDIMIVEGTFDNALAFVAEGELEVFLPAEGKRTSVGLQRVSPGMVLGEQSFFDGQPRSTSIRAITNGHWYRLTKENFLKLFESKPELGRDLLLELGRIVSLKLRETTRLLAERRNGDTEE